MTFYCILLFLESSTEWSCRRSMALRGVRGGGVRERLVGLELGLGLESRRVLLVVVCCIWLRVRFCFCVCGFCERGERGAARFN